MIALRLYSVSAEPSTNASEAHGQRLKRVADFVLGSDDFEDGFRQALARRLDSFAFGLEDHLLRRPPLATRLAQRSKLLAGGAFSHGAHREQGASHKGPMVSGNAGVRVFDRMPSPLRTPGQ